MTSQLAPYLGFDGNAREAMEFYHSIFGGTVNVTTFAEFGGGDGDVPPYGVMHAILETDRGFVLMASDTPGRMDVDTPPGRMDVQIGTAITISLSGDDADDLRAYWTALTGGGQVQMALDKQVWGGEFGMCTDRYGIPRMVTISRASA